MKTLKKIICILLIITNIAIHNIDVLAVEYYTLDSNLNIDSTESYNEDLYENISSNVGIDIKYVTIITRLLNNPKIISDKPIKLSLSNTVIQKAPFIQFDIPKSENYLPDVLYSIVYDITSIMSQRNVYNRERQEYFDALNYNTRLDILFYESLLIYTGEKQTSVDKFISIYPNILNENNIEKELNSIGINNTIRVNYIKTAIEYDYSLNNNMSFLNSMDYLILPYELNYSSRENMMLAAMSLIGKVRYTWGGGHGTYEIDGISPYWEVWNNTYDDSEHMYKCIKPSGSWCSIHGESEECCLEQKTIFKLEEYVDSRKDLLVIDKKHKEMLDKIDFSSGIPEHNMDGLDCSGYISWVYNQMTDEFNVDNTAMKFSEITCFDSIPLGDKMLPGDIFAWSSHIVLIVGKVDKAGKVYVTTEQTPNKLKFGVLYYDGARHSDIEYAKQIATEANILFGGILDINEQPHCYCIDKVKYYEEPEVIIEESSESIEQVAENNENTLESEESEPELLEFAFIGRYNRKFEDENTIIEQYNKKIKDMYAIEIIQYTYDNMNKDYIYGYSLYENNIFNK